MRRLAAAAAIALLALGAMACGATDSEPANRKADALVAAADEAGVATNLTNEVARTLYGNDGGRVCGALSDDRQPTTLGLARTRVLGQPEEHVNELAIYDRLVVEVYCPDQIERFDALLDDLHIDLQSDG